MLVASFGAFAHNHESTLVNEAPSCYIERPADVEKFEVVWSSSCKNSKASGSIVVQLYDLYGQKLGQFFGEAKNGDLMIGVKDLRTGFEPISYAVGHEQGSDIQKSFDIASKASRDYAKYLKSRGIDDLAKAYASRANELYNQMRD